MPWTLRPSRALDWTLPPISASRVPDGGRALPGRARAAVAHWAFTAAAVLLLLAWVLCVWLIVGELVGWWVEFGVRLSHAPLQDSIIGW